MLIKYLKYGILFNILPTVIIHLFLFPLWIKGNFTDLSVVIILLNMIALPLLFLFIDYHISLKHRLWKYYIFIIFIILSSSIGSFLGYISWIVKMTWPEIDFTLFFNADGETKAIVASEIIYSLIIIFIGGLVSYSKLLKKRSSIEIKNLD